MESITSGFRVINNDTDSGMFSGLSKGIFIFSLLAFVFSLIYFIYNITIYAVSFKKEDLINNKVQLIMDILFTIFIAIFAVLYLAGICGLTSDLNKAWGIDVYKIGSSYFISTALIVIVLIGHVVGASLVNSKFR
ncbi:hypothetical protein SLITO_v1c07250 [Spiroplasma litorale]|uniref:Transmembrane protein n=1 Tax=Spiroplasma litorale TaxID=216942 RepID=A0A0K1W207_9MOLU|nr:hypothetical protein [Spiroplasma litorale]AKX34350.1 hypothetical protein SLITO_v1c07250 [Spiroplasma litorale]